jgi:two-component system chemotaxis response regulator CheB
VASCSTSGESSIRLARSIEIVEYPESRLKRKGGASSQNSGFKNPFRREDLMAAETACWRALPSDQPDPCSPGVIVVIGASAGGLAPLREIVNSLPVPCKASIFVVSHIGRGNSLLPQLLSGVHPATFAQPGETVESGHIYVAPPDQHMVLVPGFVQLNHEQSVHHTRPAIDPLFISAAEAYGTRVIGIVLSGGGRDGAAGLQAIKRGSGLTFVQSPEEAEIDGMPCSAIAAVHTIGVLPVAKIAQRLNRLCG